MGFIARVRAAAIAAIMAAGAISFMPSTHAVAENNTAAQKAETAGAPISLKKFTRKKVRYARAKYARKTSGKASLVQRARASKSKKTYALRKEQKHARKVDDGAMAKLPSSVANANAFLNGDTGASTTGLNATKTGMSEPASVNAQDATDAVELAEAAEINDIDKAAWAPKDAPKLSPIVMNSRAEMREDDSPWANTSLIGKIFVVMGAMLTLGSAVRMFIA